MAIVRVVGVLCVFGGVVGVVAPVSCGLARSGRAAESPAGRDERARFQGTWQLLAVERDGAPVPDERIRSVRVTFMGDRHTVRFGSLVVARDVRFAIDPSKSPKEVTDTLSDGTLIRGIYRLEGDTLVSCAAPVDKDRPTDFRSRAGTDCALRVLCRVKGDDRRRDSAVANELQKFAGAWRVASMDVGGRPLPVESVRSAPRLTVNGARFTLADSRANVRGVYVIDPTATPKTIDAVLMDGPRAGEIVRGIYELEANTYTVYAGGEGQPRPAALPGEAAKGYILQVLKREK